MSFRKLTFVALAFVGGTCVANAQDFGQCGERIAQLQNGKTAIAAFHEIWFAPNRDWLKHKYPAAMVVSHDFGIEAVTRGQTEAFSTYENAWNTSQTGWYVVAEPSAVGSNSEHAFLPLYLFSSGDTCHEFIADWWVEIADLPPEMQEMLK